MNRLASLVDKIRSVATRHRPGDPTDSLESLNLKIERGMAVAEMMQSKGWKIFQEEVRNKIMSRKDGLIAMDPILFQTAQGLQLKAEAMGAQDALNTVADIVGSGLKAEKQMNAVKQN